MTHWQGPGEPFAVLYDGDDRQGMQLPPEAQAHFGGWRIPDLADRPYVYANFVTARDGRISFNAPGHAGGGDVSRFNAHDRWLMGLLRSRADAVLVGDNTLRVEREHIWTAQYICPDEGPAWAALRRAEDRPPLPLHVFVSLHGHVPQDAAVFGLEGAPVLVATTHNGVTEARARVGQRPGVQCVSFGAETVDLAALMGTLRTVYGVRTLLCEGGPTLYGAMLAAGQVGDEFLTLSPIVIGATTAQPRPSLVEGVAFGHEHPPSSTLLSVRRAGDYLFLRSRYHV